MSKPVIAEIHCPRDGWDTKLSVQDDGEYCVLYQMGDLIQLTPDEAVRTAEALIAYATRKMPAPILRACDSPVVAQAYKDFLSAEGPDLLPEETVAGRPAEEALEWVFSAGFMHGNLRPARAGQHEHVLFLRVGGGCTTVYVDSGVHAEPMENAALLGRVKALLDVLQ